MIPANLLPKSLRYKVQLESIGKIEFLHKRASKFYLQGHIFMKNYIPSFRYHGKCDFSHKIDPTLTIPLFRCYDKNNTLIQEFETAQLSSEEIYDKIKSIDKTKK